MRESDIERIAVGLQNAERLLIQMCEVHSALLNIVLNRCHLDANRVRSLLSEIEKSNKEIRSVNPRVTDGRRTTSPGNACVKQS